MEAWVIFLVTVIGISVLATVLALMYRGNKKKVEGEKTAGLALSTTNIVLLALLAVVIIVIGLIVFFYSSNLM